LQNPTWASIEVPAAVCAFESVDARLINGDVRAYAVGQIQEGSVFRGVLLQYEAELDRFAVIENFPAFDGCYSYTIPHMLRVEPVLTAVDIVPTRPGQFQVFVGSNCGRIFWFDGLGRDDALRAWREIRSHTSLAISSMSYTYDPAKDAIIGCTVGDRHHVPAIQMYEAHLDQ
jgi:hypothetical protein